MPARLPIRVPVPSRPTVVAIAALVLAFTAPATAAVKENSKDEVLLQTATGGPVHTGDEGAAIPLTNGSFTELAGEALLVAAHMDPTRVSGTCDLRVAVWDDNDPTGLGLLMRSFHERGEVGQDADVESLPAVATDTPRVLVARADIGLEDSPSCDEPEVDDDWIVSLSVTVVRLR